MWGGWSYRFNDRLLGDRRRLAILLPPPDGGDRRLAALFAVAVAIRDLWEAMNAAMQGRGDGVEPARGAVERAVAAARSALREPDPHGE
jgi:hypothetical protein